MPDTLITKAINHKDTTTIRTLLEDSIFDASSLRNEASYEMISRILLNDDSLNYDSLRYRLYQLKMPIADAQVALSYLETAKLDSANNVIHRIYGKYQLTGGDSAHIRGIDTLISGYVSGYAPASDTIPQPDMTMLDSTHRAQTNGFAATRNEHLQATGWARNVINILYQGNYFTKPMLPIDSLGHQKQLHLTQDENEDGKIDVDRSVAIKVYPNPANQYVNFEIDMQDPQNVTVEIYDLYGRRIGGAQFNNTHTEISTQQWAEGVYLWKVTQTDKVLKQGRVIIIK